MGKEDSAKKLKDIAKDSQSSNMKIDLYGFLGFAIITYSFYSIVQASAQDILASTNIATTSIIICFNTPYFLMTFILPYFIDKMSLMTKALSAAMFFGVGVLIITLMPTAAIRLTGVVVASIGMGVAEIGFLSATSLHQDKTIHWFTCGTGIGGILGVFYFSGMTTLACIKPTTALQILLVLLPIFPLLAWLIKRKSPFSEELVAIGSRSQVEYTPLSKQDSIHEIDHQPLTRKEKLSAVRENLYLAIPLYIGLFCDYLTIHGVTTTIAFTNSPFDPRDHFQYYLLCFWFSEMIGRSYGLVIMWFKPNQTVVTNKTWIFSAILVSNLTLLVCASWYRFLPNFAVVALLVSVTGATEGALYLNTFAIAGKDAITRPRHREFSRAVLTCALQGGIVTAALMGLYVEPHLKEHCKRYLYPDDAQCFTRLTNGQWNATLSCVLNH